MKKIASFVLMLLIVVLAAAAHAERLHVNPLFRQPYSCDYSPGPWTTEYDPGASSFGNPSWINSGLVYAIEGFESSTVGFDNRRIAFAKPVDWCGQEDPYCLDPTSVAVRTSWEFTIVNGVQCKDTRVSNNGTRIVFSACTNGKSRVCIAY